MAVGVVMQPITFTVWRDVFSTSRDERAMPWGEFCGWVASLPAQGQKERSPLVKLARFGNKANKKGCLRTDANVMEITGLEGDYDDGVVSPDEALERLERAHVRALIVTTHSHTPAAPRWRVFVPLGNPLPASERYRLVARLNGALGGCLARESFTLSQSYFIGGRPGSEYRVLVSFDDPGDGEYIDELDSLDALSCAPPQILPPVAHLQKSTEDDFCHPLFSSVGAADIQTYLPEMEGQRNKCLFNLARYLKGKTPKASRSELRAIVERWHELALPVIGTKDFITTWSDFQRGWEKVKVPYGSVLNEIMGEIDMNDDIPQSLVNLGYEQKGYLLIRICKQLQFNAGDEPFFLSARQAGELLGIHYTDAAKYLHALVLDEILELVKRGAGNKASRYRYIWPE